MHNSKVKLLLFLIGLGSQTQIHVIGSIGISEFVLFLMGPFVCMADYRQLKADGFMPFVWLSLLTCFGCLLSGFINHTYSIFLLKGLAAPYAVFASTVVLHRMLRKDFSGLRWLLIGFFLSSIISVFIFQQESYTFKGGSMLEGAEAVSAVTSNPLFWSSRIGAALNLPITAWYLSTPYGYSATVPFVSGIIKILFSDSSGRAAALVSFLGGFYVVLAGKSPQRMRKLGRNFGIVVLLMFALMLVGKRVYIYAATNNYLGEKAREKYLKQAQGSSSMLKIIMGGRLEFFTAIRACIDKPIIGFGPKPIDEKGYYETMLREYGNPDDFESYTKSILGQAKLGITIHFIPAHSHLGSFWLQYGIVGLVFWLYVLAMFLKYFTKYCSAIPQWYGYCALSIASFLWDIFFSPFSGRITIAALMTCILFARAVVQRRIQLPWTMQEEIARKCR